jgi:hypothetical protein
MCKRSLLAPKKVPYMIGENWNKMTYAKIKTKAKQNHQAPQKR